MQLQYLMTVQTIEVMSWAGYTPGGTCCPQLQPHLQVVLTMGVAMEHDISMVNGLHAALQGYGNT